MKPYPLEFRQRIIEAVNEGLGTVAEIADIFGVGERYIYKLLQRHRETGDVAPRPHGGGAVAALTEKQLLQLADLVFQFPDATLAELQQRLSKRARVSVSLSTIWRALKALDLTRKKSPAGARKPTRRRVPPSGSGSRSSMPGD